MQKITFSEKPLGTSNPQYLAKINTISFTGQIVTDGSQPTSPVLAANSSYIGPVSWTFSAPVSDVAFDAGYFDQVSSTTISYFDASGKLLKSELNTQTGLQHFSYSNAGGIARVTVVNTSADPNGFAVDSVTFTNQPTKVGLTTNTPTGAESPADVNGELWGYAWDHKNLTYSFPTNSSEYTTNGYQSVSGFVALNAAQQAAYKLIIDNYDHVSGLSFTKTTAANADIRFAEASSIDYSDGNGAHTPGNGTAEGNPTRPHDPNGATTGGATVGWGDVWFNTAGGVYDSPVVGSFSYSAGLMHELGHAVDLKHGHASQSDNGITYPELPGEHNSYEYSIMTYHTFVGDTVAQDNAPDHPSTLMLDDIATLQYLYGADLTYNSGPNTYKWDSTGKFFIDGVNQYAGVGNGATVNSKVLMTVWDGGGKDTFDFSNYSTNLVVDLNPGGWTNLGTQLADLGVDSGGTDHIARGNIAIAYDATIENAIGGTGNDKLTGNAADNVLTGGHGNDVIDGGSGINTAVYSGLHSDYHVTQISSSLVQLTDMRGGSPDGTDSDANIQEFQFADRTETITQLLYNNTPVHDANGDGKSDILLYNNNGTIGEWFLNSTQITGGGNAGQTDTSWHVAGKGDFNADAHADILLFRDNGTVGEWQFGGTQITGGGDVGTLDPTWHVAGTGDFNNDGRSDVLLFNNNGTVGEWQLNGTQITGGGNVGTLDPTWHIAGTGDFNHDGRSDVLLFNNNGTVGEWQLNGTQITGGGNIGTLDPTWHIAGTGDFNHDGNSDILLVNNNGTVGEWQLNGTQIIGGGNVGQFDSTWHIATTGDYNGDGNSDVLLVNNNGVVGEWQLNGTQIVGGGNVGAIDPTWHI
jgi:serralysin